jgi:hypothetical protein
MDANTKPDYDTHLRTYFHVAEQSDAQQIMLDGFEGGWGDVGFGVYMYGTLASAQQYASQGGWDGRLKHPCILELRSNEPALVTPEPSWPNPEDYCDVYWHEMDEDREDPPGTNWKPEIVACLDREFSRPRRPKP